VRSGCAGLARVDFFVDGEEVLRQRAEHDAGLHADERLRRLFAASGIPYEELLDRLVELAVERHAASRSHRF
jgi:D-alanine-D-alanine ligase